MVIIAKTEIDVLESVRVKPGRYYLYKTQCVFNREWRNFEMLTVIRSVEDKHYYVSCPLGYGANKIQAVAISIATTRDAFQKKFDDGDLLCFANEPEQPLKLPLFVKALSEGPPQSNEVREIDRRIKKKWQDSRLGFSEMEPQYFWTSF